MPAQHIVWLNGEILPADAARVSIDDAAITSGVTVAERLRTFHHEPFLMEPHLNRLLASAEAAYIEPPLPKSELGDLVREIVRRNADLIPTAADLTVSIWLSPGTRQRQTLCIAALPIPAAQYAKAYTAGLRLAVPPTRALDPESLSPTIKTRNRLQWHIADRQADMIDPGAAALLVDRDGFVTETAAANVFAVREGRLLTPRRTKTLAGISQQFIFELAGQLDFDVAQADLPLKDFLNADEVFCSSSVSCLQPVVRINQSEIGAGVPGPVYQQLLQAWSETVRLDIAGQMQRLSRPARAC